MFERSVSLLLPPPMERDTSTMAQLTFYHGGGRYAGKHLAVSVYYLNADFYPGLPPHFDTLPGAPACWTTPGWLTRVASDRDRPHNAMRVWYRRSTSARRWVLLYIESDHQADSLAIMAIAVAARPDTAFWRRPQ